MDFDIEGSYNCNFDYIEIRDGDNGNSTLIGKYCGDPSLTPDPGAISFSCFKPFFYLKLAKILFVLSFDIILR